MNHQPHFPITPLAFEGDLIVAAALAHPEIPARLPAGYVTATAALLAKIPADASAQEIKAELSLGVTTRSTTV